jgi:hypothetical protein
MKMLSGIAVGLGVALLAASLVWAFLFPASRSWTEEKSKRMDELGSKGHVLVAQLDAAQRRPKMHGGRSAAEIEAEYKQVKAELTELREEFEGKRDAPKNAARFLQWAGILLVAGGALATFASRG